MGYIALYRKWRPTVFEEVVGQSHITMTLKNQIKNDNIAHAYLFCGTRGTGKTSTAKIFARAINCPSPRDFNPCNECEICKGILNESIMDVIEIDAASNNGVDNIRELRENVKYPPAKAKFKVYIIDEVHMLSQGAFNALLKTLEEPPSYVIFVLATTEPQKIPSTILSRCQRFDFKRVISDEIFKRLKHICTQMKVEVEDEALKLIVRNSDGAVRDSLSILDQCISFSEGSLTYEKVIETLGIVTDEFLFKLTDAIYDENSKKAIQLIDELINSGKDINQFIKDLINHFRNLMMTKMTESLEEVIDMSKENIERLRVQGKNFELNTIMRAIDVLSRAETEIKWSSQPRILLELAIVKLIQPGMDESIEALLDRVSKLENKLYNLKIGKAKEKYTSFIEKNGDLEITNKDVEIPNKKEDINSSIRSEKKFKEDIVKDNIDENNTICHSSNVNFKEIRAKWDTILKEIKKRKVTIHAFLMEGKPIKTKGNQLIIAFKDGFGFHRDATSKKGNSNFIEAAILEITGQRVRLKCVMEDELNDFSNGSDEIVEDSNESEKEKEINMVKEYFLDFEDKLEIIE
ncbi:DNA polymerase III subunit gamma/tau [Paramaledivibacter caminithermalis]|jgi:DNA polymerase-3 subunit gamma/tau|uniref:DNA-directed DNA polymerase n=1 Tax=Paramaledivibacter caminithermalis (strain DSM 15212 / CIP 107654 / DViRD3) TaxID=1121301 RepID=A0A1M6TQK9_PARC5|nr:DNA polymerase III subunit gamma/tau [Paramaledivibacter caminithermalis]SHK59227.1 DNA polymerase-3 subunit gamma/tau [Paramaledivibacter caminithermalis DSM 15212]